MIAQHSIDIYLIASSVDLLYEHFSALTLYPLCLLKNWCVLLASNFQSIQSIHPQTLHSCCVWLKCPTFSYPFNQIFKADSVQAS